MYMWPKEIQQIIAEVLHAKNPISCLEKFKNYEPAKKITFLLFNGNPTTNFRHIIHDYNLSKYSMEKYASNLKSGFQVPVPAHRKTLITSKRWLSIGHTCETSWKMTK